MKTTMVSRISQLKWLRWAHRGSNDLHREILYREQHVLLVGLASGRDQQAEYYQSQSIYRPISIRHAPCR